MGLLLRFDRPVKSRAAGICFGGAKATPSTNSGALKAFEPATDFRGNKRVAGTRSKARRATGLFPVIRAGIAARPFNGQTACRPRSAGDAELPCALLRVRSPAPTNAPNESGRIGRQAPVKRCLARLRNSKFEIGNSKNESRKTGGGQSRLDKSLFPNRTAASA